MTLERTVSRRFYLSTKAMGNKISITHDPYADTNVAGGKFHTFLTEVFKLLEVKANAEHCIKELLTEENADLK